MLVRTNGMEDTWSTDKSEAGKSQQIDINMNKLGSGYLHRCMRQNIEQSSYLRRLIMG